MSNKTAIVTAASQGIGAACARRYGRYKIRMNNLLPGFVDSYPATEEIRKNISLGREATVNEIAKGVLFLLSDDSKYITGQNLIMDGSMVVTE